MADNKVLEIVETLKPFHLDKKNYKEWPTEVQQAHATLCEELIELRPELKAEKGEFKWQRVNQYLDKAYKPTMTDAKKIADDYFKKPNKL